MAANFTAGGRRATAKWNCIKRIVDSCDIFFYNMGKLLGIDKIAYYGAGLGLGKRTGVDLPSEETGLMPSEEWVQRVYHHKWYAGETISVAVGQGAVTVTPIQLARMAAGVASGGTLVQPHLLKGFSNAKVEHFPLSDEAVEQVTQGLFGVVNEGGRDGLSPAAAEYRFLREVGDGAVDELRRGEPAGHQERWMAGLWALRRGEIRKLWWRRLCRIRWSTAAKRRGRWCKTS